MENLRSSLPTIVVQVKEEPLLVDTDPLPILVTIPLPIQNLNLISLHTQSTSVNLESPNNSPGKLDEQTNERYKEIAAGLEKAVEQHDVDVIFLQIVSKFARQFYKNRSGSNSILKCLKDKFETDWVITHDVFKSITCYRKKRFEKVAMKSNLETYVRSYTLKDKFNNDILIDLHNIRNYYEVFPHNKEIYYRTLLGRDKDKTSAIVGSINLNSVPIYFNNLKDAEPICRISNYPDGGFYKDQHNQIFQLDIKTLNFQTGEIVEHKRSEELDFKNSSEYQMAICLDQSFQTTPVINNKTIFEYEAALQESLLDRDILVRMAVNDLNKKALGIRFSPSSNAYNFIKKHFEEESDFQFNTVQDVDTYSWPTYPCVFAPLEKIEALHNAIAKYLDFDLSETIYSLWACESKVGFVFEIPRMADTKNIDAALKEYHQSVKTHFGFAKQKQALEKVFPLVNSWIKNQDDAFLPRFSERYSAVKNLQTRLQVVANVLNNPTYLLSISENLDQLLKQWKNYIDTKKIKEKHENITGINQMFLIFKTYNETGNFNYKLSIFYQIKKIAEQRLSGTLLSQLYYKSSIFGGGRNATGVQSFYEDISKMDFDKICKIESDLKLQHDGAEAPTMSK